MTQTRRRELMIEALEGDYAFEALKALIQGLLNEGIANEILLEDLAQIKGLLPGKLEEIAEDVMDLLTGWCAPEARLVPE